MASCPTAYSSGLNAHRCVGAGRAPVCPPRAPARRHVSAASLTQQASSTDTPIEEHNVVAGSVAGNHHLNGHAVAEGLAVHVAAPQGIHLSDLLVSGTAGAGRGRRKKAAAADADSASPSHTADGEAHAQAQSAPTTPGRRRKAKAPAEAPPPQADHVVSADSVTAALAAANAAADAAETASTSAPAHTPAPARKARTPKAQLATPPPSGAAAAPPVASPSTLQPVAEAVEQPAASPPETREAARARIAALKTNLLQSLRRESRSPSANSVNLILTPLPSKTGAAPAARPVTAAAAAAGGAASPQPSPPQSERLRAVPLAPLAPRSSDRSPERLPPSRGDARGYGDEREGQEERGGRTGPGRVLRPQQRSDSPFAKPLGPFAQQRGDYGRDRTPADRAERVERPEPEEEEGLGGRALKPRALRRAEEAARRAREAPDLADRERRAAAQRSADEEYARYVEGVAAAVAAEARLCGGAGAAQPAAAAGPAPVMAAAAAAAAAEPVATVAAAAAVVSKPAAEPAQRQPQAAAPAPEKEKEREQVDLLKGLAAMFRNFARKPSPAAAAAALVAGSAAAAGAAATSAASGKDIRLILSPLENPAPEPELAPAADEAAQARALEASAAATAASRASLLTLLKPVPVARLPTITRRKAVMGFTRKRFRLRAPSAEDAEEAGVAPEGEAGMSPAEVRLLRRKAYFYRQIAPKRLTDLSAGAGAGAEGAEEEGVQGTEGASALGALAAGGAVAAAAAAGAAGAAKAADEEVRPKGRVTGRSYNMRLKEQYKDRLKRVVRKAAPVRVGPVVAASVAAASAAKSAAAPSTAGAEDDAEAEGGAEVEARGEYNSAAEVANDVYEQVMGVRLPERAMYGRRAEALAAMSPQQIKERSRAWVDACGKEYALAFHAREPLLLARPPEELLLTLEAFSRVFDLPPDACVAAALKAPELVGLPEQQLAGTVAAVSDALEMGMGEAGKIVLKMPRLVLSEATFPVARRVALLGALLPVSRDKLRQVVRRRPQLLTKSLQSLAAFMMTASQELGLPLFDVALLIAGSPGVTGVNSARLSSRWAAIRAATARVPAWRSQLQALPPPSLGRCLVANETAIARLELVADKGLDADPSLASFPQLLTMSAGHFKSLVSRAERQQGSQRSTQRQAGATAQAAAMGRAWRSSAGTRPEAWEAAAVEEAVAA
ncbi:hypothetical protein HYH03_000214 [Edaphochlamys debaryana]|uniref:Uncharacterized protein n=1 Tax=Edaphochlamys debaryana TaxID=47281 RepID=A0A835YI99_9CHLO|nr:hypothetical protein HYH03_000214 [Edaphochlamys debaryana]|eukprot:KAG2501713.1 hypothetical protein HYH03_000214 [Edaphochlamys debaryana]